MLHQIIEDDALYPGHVVKRLLQVQSGSDGRAVRWMPATEAAARLGRKPDTFRKQCERYAKMDNPPIRVRKAGPTKKSPWEVCEDDVFALELLGQPRPRTLRELFTAYEKAHPKWSMKHLRDQRLNQRFWEDRLGKDTPLTDVTPAKAAAVIRREMEVNDQFGERVQQKRVRYLKDAYTYARDHEKWITHQHDLTALEVPKVRGDSKPYTLAEVMRLLPATEKVDLRLAALSRIAFTTGRREAAIRTLPATAYSVERIEGKPYGVLQFPADTDKARKSGMVVITGRTRELVEELLDTRAVRTSGWLFPSGDLDRDATTYISDQWMRNKLKEAEALAKVESIPGRAFHALKRRFATQARKYDADAASKMSGTTGDTLEWYYVQDDLEPKAGLAEYMEELA